MTGVTLRPYQADAIGRCRHEVATGRRRILVVAPTGSGKTVIAAGIVAAAAAKGRRTLFLAHRRELVVQASQKLHTAGIDAGLVLPGYAPRPGQPVQVASIQSLHGRALRSDAMTLPPADLVVVDEAHHAPAGTYRELLARYPGAVILGLTATPCRADGRGLGAAFDVLVEAPTVAELTRLGHLVPAVVYAPSAPDLTGIATRRGDYAEAELAERVDRPELIGDIVEHWHRLAQRRRTVVFAASVAHSIHLRDQFARSGVVAEHLDGSTPIDERDAILARLASGEVEVVVNCAVLTEGWDCPEVACVVLARPTKSLGLYRQMVGRVLRPAPGKVDALILDHAGAVFAHGLPDDEIAWTLREDRRAENRQHVARAHEHGAPGLVECRQCGAVRLAGRPCTVCGWLPKSRGEDVVVADGDLAKVGRDRVARRKLATADDKRRFHAELLGIAQERGYAPGWASHKYRDRFKEWPQGSPSPAEPSPATRSWVRSRQIAYAKARAKGRAA